MTPDAFSEQRMPAPPLELDLTRTAVIVVDMVGRVSVEWMGLVNPLTFVQYSEGDQLK